MLLLPMLLLLHVFVLLSTVAATLEVPSCNHHTVYTYPVENIESCVVSANAVYFHGIFDFQKHSSMALFVNQVCRAMSVCIPPENFRLVLHTLLSPTRILQQAEAFLAQYRINHVIKWKKAFDTVAANHMRQAVLADVNRPDQLILQADADEFVSFDLLSHGVTKLLNRSNKCNHLMGNLRERVEREGHLINITLHDIRTPGVTRINQSIEENFPWTCSLKKTIEDAEDRKLVLYQAVYRPAVGNHRLLCATAKRFSHCTRALKNATHIPPRALWNTTDRPRLCSWGYDAQNKRKKLYIDHYKYTYGIIGYLKRRVQTFRAKRLAWWKESDAMIQYFRRHHNHICLNCTGTDEATCKLVKKDDDEVTDSNMLQKSSGRAAV